MSYGNRSKSVTKMGGNHFEDERHQTGISNKNTTNDLIFLVGWPKAILNESITTLKSDSETETATILFIGLYIFKIIIYSLETAIIMVSEQRNPS